MPDNNRFAGLSDVVAEDEQDEDTAPEGDESTDESDRQTTEPDPDAAEPKSPAESGPAFEFDDTTAKSIYVREETLATLEDTEFEVESLLRREHGIRDLTGREFHDAAVRVLAANVEDIVEVILETRGPTEE